MKFINILILLAVFVGFNSCSKDDDGKLSNSKDALKITVTSSSSFTNDNSDISVSVSSSDSKSNPMKWGVNGVNGTDGQMMYTVSKEFFYGGKTAVLKSQANYARAAVMITAFSIEKPFSLTYKVEQGNKVVVEKTETINPSATPFMVSLSY